MTESQWVAHPYPILALETARGWPSPRKQRLFAVAVCRRLAQPSAGDARWPEALAVAERYAARRARREEMKAAHAGLTRSRSTSPTYADLYADFARQALWWACHPTVRAYAAQATIAAATAAAYAALPPAKRYAPPAGSPHYARYREAQAAETAAHVALLRDVCGDPFRPVVARVGRAGREAVALAEAAFSEREGAGGELSPARLAVLSDALEDAGAASEAVLAHLRSAGPHVPGCWALDLVLGKG